MIRALVASSLVLLVFIPALSLSSAEPQELTVDVVVAPSTLALRSNGAWVTVHADIPLSVVSDTWKALELNGVEVVWIDADNHGDLVAKFAIDEVKAIVSAPSADLTLTGVTNDGTPFAGTDTIRVVD